MLLVESIKCRQVEGNFATVAHFPEPGFCADAMTEDGYVETEQVVADRFRDITGRSFEIGMTKEVRDVLGLPLEAFREMHDRIDTQHRTIVRLGKQLTTFETMPWRQRLVYLFRGGSR